MRTTAPRKHARVRWRPSRVRLLARRDAVPTGWDLSRATCSDGSNPSNIDVTEEEVVTCTFTNRKRGRIVVVQDSHAERPAGLQLRRRWGAHPLFVPARRRRQRRQCPVQHAGASTDVAPGSGYSISQTTPGRLGRGPERRCSNGSSLSNIDVAPGRDRHLHVREPQRYGGHHRRGQGRATRTARRTSSSPPGAGISPSSFQLDDDGDANNGLSNPQQLHASLRGDGYSVCREPVPPGGTCSSATCSRRLAAVEHRRGPLGDGHLHVREPAQRGRIVVVKDADAQRPAGLRLHRRWRAQPDVVPARRRRQQHERVARTLARSTIVAPGSGYSITESAPPGWQQT